jgi:hypothetical protein
MFSELRMETNRINDSIAKFIYLFIVTTTIYMPRGHTPMRKGIYTRKATDASSHMLKHDIE